jgi:electron transfer flavoprotein alpha/beta subunit
VPHVQADHLAGAQALQQEVGDEAVAEVVAALFGSPAADGGQEGVPFVLGELLRFPGVPVDAGAQVQEVGDAGDEAAVVGGP